MEEPANDQPGRLGVNRLHARADQHGRLGEPVLAVSVQVRQGQQVLLDLGAQQG
jgi:hypothetical protein